MVQTLGGFLLMGGLALALVGVLLLIVPSGFSWIGQLPGDISVKGENYAFYFPLTTLIVVNGLIFLVVRMFQSMKG